MQRDCEGLRVRAVLCSLLSFHFMVSKSPRPPGRAPSPRARNSRRGGPASGHGPASALELLGPGDTSHGSVLPAEAPVSAGFSSRMPPGCVFDDVGAPVPSDPTVDSTLNTNSGAAGQPRTLHLLHGIHLAEAEPIALSLVWCQRVART